jgi:mono/diheme cytochrome c family protein
MRALAGVTVFAAALTVGCHLDMYDQPKFKPFAANTFYPDKASSRPLVEGTVPRGSLIDDELLASGKINGKLADLFPFPVTRATVMRGQDRFNTFCSPCHGRLADGGGMIVARGFPRPPSLLSDSLRVEPAGFFFDVMTNGFGRMYSYARSVPVGDRWAIVAYLRSLQLSQRVSLAELPEIDRQHFQGSHR